MWSRDKSTTLYFYFHKVYGPQTYRGYDLGWGDTTNKVTWHLYCVVTWQIKNILSSYSQVTIILAGWWLEWEDPAQHVICHLNQGIKWQLSSRSCTFVTLLVEAISLKKVRFQVIMITLKMCSLYKGSPQGDVLLSSWVFIRKKIEEPVSGIIYFCVYIKSVPSLQTRQMIKNA